MSTSVLLGILTPFRIRQDLLKHVEMGDQRVDDLWVTWAGDAVFSYVGRPDNPGTKFWRRDVTSATKSIADFVKRVFASEMSTRHSVIMACVQHHGYTGAGNHKLIAERTSFTKMTGEIRPV